MRTHRIRVCVDLLLALTLPLHAAARDGLQPMDIFNLQQAAAPSIAPDGKTVAYTLIRRDIVSDTKRSTIEMTRDLATWSELPGSEGCSKIIWSPDSRHFALLCYRNQRGILEVRALDQAGGLIVVDEPGPIIDATWSRDGVLISFERFVKEEATDGSWKLPVPPVGAHWAPPFRAPEYRMRFRNDDAGDFPPGSFQTFLVPANGSSPIKKLTSDVWWTGFGAGPDLTWSADGSEVYISANHASDWDMHASDRAIYAINTETGTVRRVTRGPGSDAQPALSPDGRLLAYTGVQERGLSVQNRRVFVMSATGDPGRGTPVAPYLDRSIDQFYWLPKSDGFVVSYEDAGTEVLATISINGRVTELARNLGGETLELPFSYGSFATARDGTAVFLHSTATVPSDVAIKKVHSRTRIIAQLNEALRNRIGGFTTAEPFWVSASLDGTRVQAWLMRARTGCSEPTPLILDIHGGPYAQYGDRFSIKYQLYVSAGYNVVFANPRGSTGYGENFGNLTHNSWPGDDEQDLLDVVDAAAHRDFIDPKALFVTGTSGGATMTLWSVAHSDRFRAAVASKPLVDWISWTLTSDFGAEVYAHWLGGALPWNDIHAYWRRSVLSLAGQIHTPVLLISGDDDLRAPPGQALEMFTALKLAGIETALVRGPEVSHNSVDYRPSMFLQEVAYTLGWFDRHKAPDFYNEPGHSSGCVSTRPVAQ